MECQTKTGKVYLQPHKAGKKWKHVWLSLFPPSSSGVGRLEIQDLGGAASDYGTVTRRHHADKKVVRLSELISVLRLPPNAEACPKEMSAFCVETHEKTLVFAAPKDECVDWVEKLCQSTFQKGSTLRSTQLHMEDNQIYASTDEVHASEFWVAVQRTEPATRCGLQGSYWLLVAPEALQLRDPQKKDMVREWPYELLRRYGKDGLTLTIEAGRRCESGPGTFIFETQQAERIFSLIQSTIKRKTSSVCTQNQEGEKVVVINRAHSPLPRTPDTTSMNLFLENKLKIQGRKCSSLEDIQGDLVGQSESVVVHPAPITLMPLPSVPTRSPFGSPRSDQADVIYANPGDCSQPSQKAPQIRALYVDPTSVLPLKPPGSRDAVTPNLHLFIPHPAFNIDHPDSGYSEVYDKIYQLQNKPAVLCKGNAKEEPIYTEPVTKKEETPPRKETKSDPFAHLYAQVCKTGRVPSPAPSSNTAPTCTTSDVTVTTTAAKDADQLKDDVIYESLGVI